MVFRFDLHFHFGNVFIWIGTLILEAVSESVGMSAVLEGGPHFA